MKSEEVLPLIYIKKDTILHSISQYADGKNCY